MNEPIVIIEIVEYDPRWPDLYAEERARVEAMLDDLAESIEHIGSTSIPGLSAKPIIDILVTVAHSGPVEPYIERLGSLGYTYFPVLGNRARYSFGRGIPHTHHIHIVEREHPDVAATLEEYADLMRLLGNAHETAAFLSQQEEQ